MTVRDMTGRKKEASPQPHYHGHRERLRSKVLTKGAGSLSDYELIEFLLFGARPRGDVKPLAKTLLGKFGSLAGVLSAEHDALKAVPGTGQSATAYLKIVQEAARRLALEPHHLPSPHQQGPDPWSRRNRHPKAARPRRARGAPARAG